jgi:hypothetical protein
MERLKKPKEFLNKLRLIDSDYQDNGMINHIADLLERYNKEDSKDKSKKLALRSIQLSYLIERAQTPKGNIVLDWLMEYEELNK